MTTEYPPVARTARCRSCGATVAWITTPTGKLMPADTELAMGRVYLARDDAGRPRSHFATCPDAATWRARQKAAAT